MGRDGVSGVERGAAEPLLAAESLLRGDGRHAAPDELVHLLAAATAPARPYELVGEESAVVAFRQARRPPAPAPGRRTLLARLLTVKVTAAFAVTAIGGVAVAAAGGFNELPGTSGFAPRPAAPTATPSATPRTAAPSTRAPAGVARTPTATPTPQPLPENLCRIFIADPRNQQAGNQVNGLDSQALAALIALAGGKVAGVWSYCSRMLSTAGGGPAMPWPTTGTGQPWHQYRTYSTGPNDWRSHFPQPSPDPGQNQVGQSDPQAADRGSSPSPGSRSAQASPSPGGRR